ncbi:hypothetical protein ACE6H2_009991 [Prunus campanulata]
MGVVRKRTGCNSKYPYRNIATPASSLLSPMSSSSSSARQMNISVVLNGCIGIEIGYGGIEEKLELLP